MGMSIKQVKTGAATQDECVAAVREFALANYEQDGWDMVVEAFTDQEIIDCMHGAKTRIGAISWVASALKSLNGYREDIVLS